jgi:hypothetical protein
LISFISHLKAQNSNVNIDILSTSNGFCDSDVVRECIDNIYTYGDHSSNFIAKLIPRHIIRIIKLRKTLHRIRKHYDIINLQTLSYFYSFVIKDLRQLSNVLVATPWGSDIYRTSFVGKILLKRILHESTYITCVSKRFKEDIIHKFYIKPSKAIDLDIGSDTIDYIVNNKLKISVESAKKTLNIDGKYVITFGYNAQKAQNHLKFIHTLESIKHLLPSNTIIILPLTYGGDDEYKRLIKETINSIGINYKCFETYLSSDRFFLLTQATDLFIHIQTTDANSATLQEFLLCEKKVVNGSWLKYPQLIYNGAAPFFEVENIENLDETIITAINSEIDIPIQTLEEIKKNGWKYLRKQWDDFFLRISQ